MIGRALFIALALGGSPAPSAGEKDCQPFDAKAMGSGYTFMRVTPGQYHFLQGVWAMSPKLPGALPPGDGAAIVRKAKTPGGVVAWMKAAKVCTITPIPDELLKAMASLKTGALDADGSEI